MRPVLFEGHRCLEVVAGDCSALVATDFGPRVLGLRHQGDDLFAYLPEATIPGPSGAFRMWGGHRLWDAPEVPERTYLPDEDKCEVDVGDSHVTVKAGPNSAGLERSIRVDAAQTGFTVTHVIVNQGDPILIAPWAISQLPLGGAAILPLGSDHRGGSRYEADRMLVLWPYTDLSDDRIRAGSDRMVVRAEDGPRLKIGSGQATRTLGYLRAGTLFVKSFSAGRGGDYADLGAHAQVFVGDGFCELESLGPLAALGPGQAVEHVERWHVSLAADVAEPDIDKFGAITAATPR